MGVLVGVGVSVGVGVKVGVRVGVCVGVEVGVFVGLGVKVGVRVGVSVLENGTLTSPLEQREMMTRRTTSKIATRTSTHFLDMGVFAKPQRF